MEDNRMVVNLASTYPSTGTTLGVAQRRAKSFPPQYPHSETQQILKTPPSHAV